MEGLQRIRFFADAEKLDRFPGGGPDRQHGAAARVSLHLRQDHAGQPDALLEPFRHGDGILAGHGVRHQQHFVRHDGAFDVLQFLHQLIVNVETTSRIQDHHVIALIVAARHPLHAGPHHIRPCRAGAVRTMHRHLEVGSQAGQLVAGRGAARVGRYQEDAFALLFEHPRELAAGRRLAGALYAHHHDHGGRNRREAEAGLLPAHQVAQFVPHEFHDLVARGQAFQHVLAGRLLTHPVDEVFDDPEMHVRLEQSQADLLQRLRDVLFGQDPVATEFFQNLFELFAEAIEHVPHSRKAVAEFPCCETAVVDCFESRPVILRQARIVSKNQKKEQSAV